LKDKLKLVCVYGNRHETVENPVINDCGIANKHKWTAFFELEDNQVNRDFQIEDLVEKVCFELSSGFQLPYIEVKQPPF